MPTVLLIDGLAFKVNINDHGPPHTHVWKSGLEVRLSLMDLQEMPGTTMRPADVRKALDILRGNLETVWGAWRTYHG